MRFGALGRCAIYALAALMANGATAAGYPLRVEATPDEDGVWQVTGHNRGSSAVVVQLELVKPVNARQAGTSKAGLKVLEPGAKEVLTEIVPVDPGEQVSFDWEVKWTFGRGNGKGTHDGLYRPPFPGDLTFDTNNSASEHPNREKYAVDIMMPPDTRVIAARSGWVMDVAGEESGDRVQEGLRPAYMSDRDAVRMGSYVRILHDDGTWAEYSGLKQGSIKVTPGIKVEAGTQIALSGERVGSEPHITFAVMKPVGGFGQPESLPIRMEMAGRGVVAVVAGNAMGASLSVTPGPNLVKADPLVIARVEKGVNKDGDGVIAIREKLTRDPTLMAAAGGLIAAVLIGFVGLWVRRSKNDQSWGAWLKAISKRGPPQTQGGQEPETAGQTEDSADFAAARMQGDLRPKAGELIAAWEAGAYASIGTALRPGYTVMAKVALNRLFPRPSQWAVYPGAHAQMRGESIDFVVVRLRDTKIVAAIDIRRETLKMPWTDAVNELRHDLLNKAGIKHLEISADIGPDELRKRLGNAMSEDVVALAA
ncbi:MAG: DUF2726 domain-containing protein [Nevskiaceae bacterium]|nr:MAG: DUF2726 domain-containing protein [Nevskiaceae bacterium]